MKIKRTAVKLLSVGLVLSFCISMCIFVYAGTAEQQDTAMNSPGRETADPDIFSVPIRIISKHGNVKLDTSFDEMKAHDMEVGDIITVFVGDDAFDMPIGTNFTDVDTGEMVCLFDAEDNEIELAINMGSFAETAGIGDNSGFHGEIGLSQEQLDQLAAKLQS